MMDPKIYTEKCNIATIIGYIDDVQDIKDDPELETDVENWIKHHPEYSIIHKKYVAPPSSGYPICCQIIYYETSYGREYIDIEHWMMKTNRIQKFKLRNIDTQHELHLELMPRLEGGISATIRDAHGCYVVIKKIINKPEDE